MCDADRSMGGDMAAWAADGFRADHEIIQLRQNGLRNGAPSRLAGVEFIAQTQFATIVATNDTIIKITVPPHSPNAAGAVLNAINREVQLGAALCDDPEPALIGVTTVWTIPSTLLPFLKLSPLSALPNDFTQLLPPATARKARVEILHMKYNTKLSGALAKNPHARTTSSVRMLYDLWTSAASGNTDVFYQRYFEARRPPPFLVATEQPRIAGITLHELLRGGDWTRIRPALRATIAALDQLQAARHLQHGDFSPDNIMVRADNSVAFIDLARAWMVDPALARRGVALPTHTVARGFDLRFLGVWLAAVCARMAADRKKPRTPPAGLRAVAAALLAPSRAMIDEVLLGRIHCRHNTYTFHGPRSASYADYVVRLADTAAWLLSDDVATAGARVAGIDGMLFDVGPWTAATSVCMQRAVLDDPTDLCVPKNALQFDVLAE